MVSQSEVPNWRWWYGGTGRTVEKNIIMLAALTCACFQATGDEGVRGRKPCAGVWKMLTVGPSVKAMEPSVSLPRCLHAIFATGSGCVDLFCFLDLPVKLWTSQYLSDNFPLGLIFTRVSFCCLFLCVLEDDHSLLSVPQCAMLSPARGFVQGAPSAQAMVSSLVSESLFLVNPHALSNLWVPSLNILSSWQPSLSYCSAPLLLHCDRTVSSFQDTKCVIHG